MQTVSLERAVAMIPDGTSLMIGGFMATGTPERVVDEIVRQNKRNLTVIANDTASPGRGIGKLIAAKLVRKAIVSHIGLNPETQRQMTAGELAVELVPQGTLIERIRAGGYGLGNGFLTTMEVSCWTFIRMAHLAEPLMRSGGTLFTMTYYGSQMVVKNYNIMGVAKAALESAVRYLAAELGPKGIRVHAISPGPLATRAASGIPEFDTLLDKAKAKAPARSLVSVDDVGVATAFLAHDAARLITGETLYVDGGYHIID
jgi:acyl CoA:acetate/3-ketoacid CoA transferase alpha subunit